jgi:hypothetical protein
VEYLHDLALLRSRAAGHVQHLPGDETAHPPRPHAVASFALTCRCGVFMPVADPGRNSNGSGGWTLRAV